jgi:hydrogenase-4 component F
MLAYSSIENMGILFIGISLGKYGIFAVLLHVLAHSLSKTSLFLTSGNILHLYKTKRIENVSGILAADPRTGWIWIISMLAIIGIPPSPIFLTKFLIVRAFWLDGMSWLAVPFFLFLIIITFGMGSTVFKMVFGEMETSTVSKKKLTLSAYAPQFILLIILFVMGINMPEKALEFLRSAAVFFR